MRHDSERTTMLLRTANSGWHAALLACFLLCAAPPRCEAQNLVANPSLELADTCALQLGFLPNGKPLFWETISDTPDYFRACVPHGSVNGIPVNTFGFQPAHEGESYAGMFTYLVDDYREMIGTQLTVPLTVGQTYYGSFWVNAAYGGPQQTGSACNNTGMLFTMNAVPWLQGMPAFGLRNYAHVLSQLVISDTVSWTLVSGSFVADSAYQYLVIGNHFTNANTTVEILGGGNPNKAYVYVDDICLSTNSTGCPLMTTVQEHADDEIMLQPVPADEWLRISWGARQMEQLRVWDAVGRPVLAQSIAGAEDVALATIDWPQGIYHVLIEGVKAKHSRKFVVMH